MCVPHTNDLSDICPSVLQRGWIVHSCVSSIACILHSLDVISGAKLSLFAIMMMGFSLEVPLLNDILNLAIIVLLNTISVLPSRQSRTVQIRLILVSVET